jgi:uracil-DNA glycosylase family 4
MSRVLFLGSNPSQRSTRSVPFWHDTNSRKILNKWLKQLNVDIKYIDFLNISNAPTPNNRPLKINEIKACLGRLENDIVSKLRPDYIVTLGKAAEKALTLMKIEETGYHFYAMPHPSGLNRLLNDPEYVEGKINGLREYLNPSGKSSCID